MAFGDINAKRDIPKHGVNVQLIVVKAQCYDATMSTQGLHLMDLMLLLGTWQNYLIWFYDVYGWCV